MTPTDTPLTPEGGEKKKRIQPAYKGLFENANRRLAIITWIAAIGWILFTLVAAGVVVDFLHNHLVP